MDGGGIPLDLTREKLDHSLARERTNRCPGIMVEIDPHFSKTAFLKSRIIRKHAVFLVRNDFELAVRAVPHFLVPTERSRLSYLFVFEKAGLPKAKG